MARTFAVKDRQARVAFQRFWSRDRTGRAGDIAIACALIAFTLPLMAILALAIKCDSAGPVFERQERIGLGGHHIVFFRFRTTVQASIGGAGWGEPSRFGRFLRHIRLDELPRLINVVRGDMTLADFRD